MVTSCGKDYWSVSQFLSNFIFSPADERRNIRFTSKWLKGIFWWKDIYIERWCNLSPLALTTPASVKITLCCVLLQVMIHFCLLDFAQDSGTSLDYGRGRSSLCSFLSNNLGFGNLWWLIGLLQFTPLLPFLVFYR